MYRFLQSVTGAVSGEAGEGQGTSPMDTRCVLVRVERHDIGLLCSLMAGYEGVAIVRTVDPTAGISRITCCPGVLYNGSGHRTGSLSGNASVSSRRQKQETCLRVCAWAVALHRSRDARD